MGCCVSLENSFSINICMRYKNILQDPSLLDSFKSRELITFECDYCNTSFTRSKHDIQRKIRKNEKTIYCSKSCFASFKKLKQLVKCKQCNKEFEKAFNQIKKSFNHFCSRSCAAIYNNNNRNYLTYGGVPLKEKIICLQCDMLISRNNKKYCSIKCQRQYEYEKYVDGWLNGKISGIQEKYNTPSNFVRRYLFELHNNQCQECGWNKINPKSNKVPLQIHHIDGNPKNGICSNLQLLCPNCHSLTTTFGSLNTTGNGRRPRGFENSL